MPVQANILNYSIYTHLSAAFPIRRFAIKYVVEGTETYTINGHKYMVHAGSYLLANQYAQGQVYMESKKPVKGICVDIAPHLMSQAVASFMRPDTSVPDLALDTFFDSADYLENQYTANQTHVGADLRILAHKLSEQPDLHREVPDELYFTLAEHIVADHIPIIKQLQQVPAIRQHTRKELYRRLCKAKEYMQGTFTQSPAIQEIARYANLSEFHFFRLFKQVYGITPHNYLMQLKLNYASQLLKESGLSIAETAALSGFSDVFAFSKAFKKRRGVTPGAWKSSN